MLVELFTTLAWMLGIYTFFHSCCCFAHVLVRNYVRKPLDISKRYGEGSWALITGSTGGIGEAYCHNLAKKNFNLVLFGRSQDKLDLLEERLKKTNSRVKTKKVVADLGESLTTEFFESLISPIRALDISILINNAGWLTNSYFEEKPLEEHLSEFRINAGAPLMLTRSFIESMLSRPSKSAIINVSSMANYQPVPYVGGYPASKRCLSLFSYYLDDNYGDKLDVQDLTPGYVKTKIANFREGGDVISPQQCVEASLRDLGQEMQTVPVPSHSLGTQFLYFFHRHSKILYRKVFCNMCAQEVLKRSLKQDSKACKD